MARALSLHNADFGVLRLYDWFSEYRLRAAGRDDILEKASVLRCSVSKKPFRCTITKRRSRTLWLFSA